MQSRFIRFGTALSATVALATAAFAQGSNDCATATVLSGFGTFPVSNVGATDSPQPQTGCTTVHNDVWFEWTAPATGGASVSSCGTVSVDTVVQVFTGAGCPVVQPLVCNDDSCGLQSSVTFSVTAGNVYMIRWGSYGAATTYTGSFAIASAVPPPPCGTNTGPDVQDLYLERIHAEDPARYQTPDGWARFETREERIAVKGSPDVVHTVRHTRHGPVMSDAQAFHGDVIDTQRFVLALRWAALDDDNATVRITKITVPSGVGWE